MQAVNRGQNMKMLAVLTCLIHFITLLSIYYLYDIASNVEINKM